MLIKITSTGGSKRDSATMPIRGVRCPACHQLGTFEPLAGIDDAYLGQQDEEGLTQLIGGQRRCPNVRCRAHLFVVMNIGDPRGEPELLLTYPAESIDFDATNLPTPV